MEPFYKLLPLLFAVKRVLHQVYGSAAGRILQNVYRAYVALKMDDVLRDEKSRLRRLNAGVVRRACAMRLPEEMETLVRRSSEEIVTLEKSGAGLEEYVRSLSEIGGKVFVCGARKEEERGFLWGLGSSIVAVLTLRDMMKDLGRDLRNGSYNPLKHCPFEEASNLLKNYYSQLNAHLLALPGTQIYAPRGGGMCGGWSQIMFCFLLCEMVNEESGLFAPVR